MALTTKSVAEYLAGAPFPAGTIAIVDSPEAISALTVPQIAALAGNGVVSLNANSSDDTRRVSLSIAKVEALGAVALSADDVIELVDSEAAIQQLTEPQVNALNTRGVDIINGEGGSLQISKDIAKWITRTNLTFHELDLVRISDDLGTFGFSAQEIAALSDKGVDILDSTADINARFTADQVIAFVQSDLSFWGDDAVTIALSTQEMSRLTAAHLTGLGNKFVDTIRATDNNLSISLDQYKSISDPLNNITLMAESHITLALSLTDLAISRDSELAASAANNIDDISLNAVGQVFGSFDARMFIALADRGITILDASDNALGLTIAQFDALSGIGGMKLTMEDTVTLSVNHAEVAGLDEGRMADMRTKGVDIVSLRDMGQVLGALTVDQISALATKGIDVFDAQDNRLTLTAAQYAALNAIRLSAADIVTIVADTTYTLSAEADHLTLTGNALRGTGNNLSNTLTGNAKSNTLSGLNGNDTLAGGLGNDTLYGGRNKDVFVFATRPNRSSNWDTIKDFSVADDTIWLDNAVFTKIGSGTPSSPRMLASKYFTVGGKAADSYDRIIYDKKTGYLSYDADGSGKGAAIVFAKLGAGLKMTAADFQVI
ncbi:calcium-binding protein [Microvirga sp. TS319]|uniref:calcium-binding protein n=1 Tax=Microvirga sp. TS319 TaxID=3241165 RepID=UPI00351A802B